MTGTENELPKAESESQRTGAGTRGLGSGLQGLGSPGLLPKLQYEPKLVALGGVRRNHDRRTMTLRKEDSN